jgi:hypothetical protein
VNLGLALVKGGKLEQAIPVLQEAVQFAPRIPALACVIDLHTALALAGLSRYDEARRHFVGAEEAARTLSKSQREALGKSFDECRLKLDAGSQGTGKPERG